MRSGRDRLPFEELLVDDRGDVEKGIPHPQENAFVSHFGEQASEREKGNAMGDPSHSVREMTGYL